MTDERRAHPRHGVEVSVQFRKDGTQAKTKDLSLGGCAIVAPRLRLVNEKLWIGLSHPKTREELDVVGEVIRAIGLPDSTFLLGVQFVEVDDALRAKLAAFIESTLPAMQAAKAAPMDEATRLVSEATDQEHAGNIPQAIRLLEQASAAAPTRADILATRARLASQTGDAKGAAHWAKRAAEVDPTNTTYAQLYQRFSGPPGAASGASASAAPSTEPRPARKAARSFVPRDRRGMILTAASGAAVLGLAGGNLWYWVLRHAMGGPAKLDPKPFRDLVPMNTLLIRDGRAYGTVDAGWGVLPDREKRLADLAGKLKSNGVTSVYLSDSSSRLVATYKDGTGRLFN